MGNLSADAIACADSLGKWCQYPWNVARHSIMYATMRYSRLVVYVAAAWKRQL